MIHRRIPLIAGAWLTCTFHADVLAQWPGSPSAPIAGQVAAANPKPVFERLAVHRNSGLFEVQRGALHGGGADYDVRFDGRGVRFEPALGTAVDSTQVLALTPTAVMRGATRALDLPSLAVPECLGRTAVYHHTASIRERYAVGVDGVELSWQFDARPAGSGDLVVRYTIDTAMNGPVTVDGGGLGFGLDGIGGVTIGGVTGVDAEGRTVAGSLHCDGRVLELSLPERFVERAAYPLVLDPIIGTRFDIWGGTQYQDSQPDCAYERNEDRYLVTFQRSFSNLDVRVRCQLIDRVGGLFQGVKWITTSGRSFRPRVASFSKRSRFGVAWAQQVGTQEVVFFRSVSAIDGAMSGLSSVGSSSHWTIADVDIGSEAGGYQLDHAFVVVWDDTNDGLISARRIGLDAAGNPLPSNSFTVFSDSTFNGYSQPAIARAAREDGKLMIVARRFSGIGPQRGIRCALVSARNNTIAASVTVEMDSVNEFWAPDVDGYGDEWVIAWRENALGSSAYRVAMRSAKFTSGALSFGSKVTLGGSSLVQVDYPSVGYSHGKTWVGYRDNVFGATSLRARGVDGSSCQSCQDIFTEPVAGGNTRIIVGTTMSGNDLTREEGLIVWGENYDLWCQRVANHGDTGTVTNLGGGCGDGGTHNARAPSIGMNRIYCSVTGLSATATLTMFNLTVAPVTQACGACVWLHPSVAVLTPVSQWQNASFGYTLPCDPGLVGVQFETQWTTLDPGTSPCAMFPGIAITDRLLQTIGQ